MKTISFHYQHVSPPISFSSPKSRIYVFISFASFSHFTSTRCNQKMSDMTSCSHLFQFDVFHDVFFKTDASSEFYVLFMKNYLELRHQMFETCQIGEGTMFIVFCKLCSKGKLFSKVITHTNFSLLKSKFKKRMQRLHLSFQISGIMFMILKPARSGIKIQSDNTRKQTVLLLPRQQ